MTATKNNLAAPTSSDRLHAALTAGTYPDARLADTLIARCAVEPDFYVRDMLTWALCRLPAESTVLRLIRELGSDTAQARSQALHTLSKIGDPRAWPAAAALLHDADDEVARSAWRAAAALVPAAEKPALAADLATALGRGDHEMQRSLSRALAGLGEVAHPVLNAAATSPDPRVRAHAEATGQLYEDPDSGFASALEIANRVAALGAVQREEAGC
ncbi:HEAT repeat domain-containing protein [Tomitella biformata]|uniref:HEAT repeat domain-containing protein n=1 Tax=Tomitella biformata TaxID=630403 RepID=UPI001F2F5120|nr:HEAT repeat domain-containing protein [Tomitella biformata]